MPKNVKIPKKIAGVKIPKKARKTANKAIKLGASPAVREIAAAAIGAAGARAEGKRKDHQAKEHRFGSRLEVDGAKVAEAFRAHVNVDGAKVAEAFRTAAIDGLRRFLEGFEEGLRDITEPAAPAEDSPKPTPSSGPRPGARRG